MNNANHSNLIFGAVWGIIFTIVLNKINVYIGIDAVEEFLEYRDFDSFLRLFKVFLLPCVSSVTAAFMGKSYLGILAAPFITHIVFWIILLLIGLVMLLLKPGVAASIGVVLLLALIVGAFSGGEDFWVFIFKD